ncbi:MAG: cytochrome b N-terminal domain-containing protein [Kofleriaceae bacterium]
MKQKLVAFLRERAALGDGKPAMLEGGASFAYVFGKVLVVLLLVEAVTGVALAAFYSPSATDAWASVAYIQDQSAMGWFVRGLHHHGGGALVIVAGLHLVQTAVAGAYKRPRELVWWLGLLLLVLLLAWAVTGYVLRWDQAGYWANRVELGIAAATPVVGGKIRDVALGGNDYGNLTLTRFYALHVVILPATVLLAVIGHIWLAKKHGTTAVRAGKAAPRWPDQALRDAAAATLTIAILVGYVVSEHGVDLSAPADPSQAFDARPLWYFRWLFELRELAGSAEKIAAMVAPAIVGGYLFLLPMLDKTKELAPRARLRPLGVLMAMLAGIAALTVMSFARDSSDGELAKRMESDATRGQRARALAAANGVPATGAQDVWSTAPMWKARTLFEQKCAGCHGARDPEKRKAPWIGPGHKDRDWFDRFLLAPSGDEFWGPTELVTNANIADAREKEKAEAEKAGKTLPPDPKKDDPKNLTMPVVELTADERASIVELLYAQTGAAVDKVKLAAGEKLFEPKCGDCHKIEEGASGASGPGLGTIGSRDWYTSFIGNPKKPFHMSDSLSSMPRFDTELTITERDQLAEYLVWLRTATKADLDALGPL